MIKIVLTDFPKKHWDTELTLAEPGKWDVDVYQWVSNMKVRNNRNRALSEVCTAEALAICMEAAPGDADEFIRELLDEEDAERVIRHYYSSKSFAHPRSLRA